MVRFWIVERIDGEKTFGEMFLVGIIKFLFFFWYIFIFIFFSDAHPFSRQHLVVKYVLLRILVAKERNTLMNWSSYSKTPGTPGEGRGRQIKVLSLTSKGSISEALFTQGCALLHQEYSTLWCQAANVHSKGIDLASWINIPQNRPSEEYLTNPAVSFPLIFLTQILSYARLLDMSGLPHEILKTVWVSTFHFVPFVRM